MLDGESPLSAEIMRAVILRDFRLSDFRYSGRTNPLVHIERFNDITGVQELSQAQRCRVFPLSLAGRVPEWYKKLPRGSVKSFEQMCQEFTEQFCGAMAPEDDMMELTSMKQRDIEIEEKNTAQIKTDRLEGLRRKEKRALPESGSIKWKDHYATGSGAGGRVTAYQPHQMPP